MGVFNVFNRAKAFVDKASLSKEELQNAELFAQTKHFREAAKIAEDILHQWSNEPSVGEQLARQVALGDLLNQVREKLQRWRKPIAEANQLAATARSLLTADTGDPLETEKVSIALDLLKRCMFLVYDPAITQAVNQWEKEFERRIKYQELFGLAQTKEEQLFFKEALAIYEQAILLYSPNELQAVIANCSSHIKREEVYEASINRANQAVAAGKLGVAIAILNSALTDFPRADGKLLVERWQRTRQGKQKFRAGLLLEKAGDLEAATHQYMAASLLLPDSTECRLRLGIMAVKDEKWQKALSHLQGINHPKAAYIRGFAYAKERDFKLADREWSSISGSQIDNQRQIINILAKRDRLSALTEIEQLVDSENLNAAKTASLAFIEKSGSDLLVETNLFEHIQPRLDAQVWQGKNWQDIAAVAEQVWLEKQDIVSLHNWAVATYYYAQTNDINLDELLIAWSTALANINLDPALKDLPWLGSGSIDLPEVLSDLKQLIEDKIDAIKEADLSEYFRLRDRYRREVTALRLMGSTPSLGVKVKDLFITPGCYELTQAKWKKINFIAVDNLPVNSIQKTLYTNWGLAVAACLEGDIARAIQIKPNIQPNSPIEKFAQQFVCYHEGCHYLHHQNWREAIYPLQQAQTEINVSETWLEEIDRLCAMQRQSISNLEEHLAFAQFWYDLLSSQSARSYLVEYKTEEIREKLATEQITIEKALNQLQQIKNIDVENPVLIDLIDRLELSYELEEIERLFQAKKMEEMVKRAKRSRHDRVRYIVAEFFIDILINGLKNGSFNDADAIQQLGRWAYEICPYEPAFQEVYHTLKIC